MPDSTLRTCTKCGEAKPLEDYYFREGRPYGCCKECAIAAMRVRQATPEARRRRREREQELRAADPERYTAKSRAYRAANREAIAERDRAYFEANRDRLRQAAEAAWAVAQPPDLRCPHCERTLPADMFYKSHYSVTGRASTCKACSRNPERGRAYYERNREQSIATVREWQRMNPTKVAEARIRRRAREAAASAGPLDLDALWTGFCSICSEPMDRSLKRPDPLSPSVDHVIPIAKGGAHGQENLAWAHLVCNMRKGDRVD